MKKKKPSINMTGLVLILFSFVLPGKSAAQTSILNEWITKAVKNNNSVLAGDREIQQNVYLKRTASDIGKTNLSLQYGQYNSYAKKDNSINISQTFPFPTAIAAKNKLGAALVESSVLKKNLTKAEIVFQVKNLYYESLNLNEVKSVLIKRDSIYNMLFNAAALRYKTGETNLLEKSKAEARSAEIKNQLQQIENDEMALAARLKALLNESVTRLTDAVPQEADFSITIDSSLAAKNPYVMYLKQQVSVADNQKKVEKNVALPDITIGYFNQTLYGVPLGFDASAPIANYNNRFQGIHAGISIPLWFAPHSAKIKAAEQMKQNVELQYKQANINAVAELEAAYQQYLKTKRSLNYYKTTGLPNAELIIKQSILAFQKGEIAFTENMINLQQADEIRYNYLNTLLEYNKSIITLEFLSGITN